MTRPLRTALVGCGKVGSIHARALRELPESEFVAVCDASADRAKDFADRWGARPFAEPDDMLSIVVQATLEDEDPPMLSDGELYAFFSLLFAAGAETTRNAIAGGLLALVERPAQLAALRASPALLSTAIEEMLRWTTPSPSKRRTATRTAMLGGQTIAPGGKVIYRNDGPIKPLDLRRAIVDVLGRTYASRDK